MARPSPGDPGRALLLLKDATAQLRRDQARSPGGERATVTFTASSATSPSRRPPLSCGPASPRPRPRSRRPPCASSRRTGSLRASAAAAARVATSLMARCGEGCAAEQPLGKPAGFGHQLVVGDDPTGQPDLVGPRGIDALARQQELHGVLPPDALREADRADDGRRPRSAPRETRTRPGRSR